MVLASFLGYSISSLLASRVAHVFDVRMLSLSAVSAPASGVPPCAVYYRVSTSKQSTDNQKPAVSALLAARGLRADFVFEEQASAACVRPQFQAMLAAARAGSFRVLVIWALDRFGRSMAGNMTDLLALDQLGVTVISVKEPWLDTGGPVRELLVSIFSWVAQQERARLIERTNAGLAIARANGKRLGRPSPNLVPNWREIVAQWHKEPCTMRELAKRMGGVSESTAWRKVKGRC